MNRLTITIESKGGPDAELIPLHATTLRDLLRRWDDGKIKGPTGEVLIDYDNIQLSWKVERGVKDTF